MSIEDTPVFIFGLEGEFDIKALLQNHGAYLIHQYNYKEDQEFKGPRLHGLENEYVLPDFDVMKKGTRVWVEVKTKTERSFHHLTREYTNGFNKRHYYDYLEVEKISGNEVWVVFVERSGPCPGVTCCRSSITPVHHFYDGKKMGRDGMVFFNVKHLLPLEDLLYRLNRADVIKNTHGQIPLKAWGIA